MNARILSIMYRWIFRGSSRFSVLLAAIHAHTRAPVYRHTYTETTIFSEIIFDKLLLIKTSSSLSFVLCIALDTLTQTISFNINALARSHCLLSTLKVLLYMCAHFSAVAFLCFFLSFSFSFGGCRRTNEINYVIFSESFIIIIIVLFSLLIIISPNADNNLEKKFFLHTNYV